MENQQKTLSNKVINLGWIFLGLGALIIILSFVLDKDRAMFDYLTMYMFILSIGLGSLALVALEYLAGAVWSTPFRRVSEFLASVVPLLLILVIPILFGLHDLYHWTHKEVVEADPILQGKEPYLNVGFFLIRVFAFIAVWILFYVFLIRNSQKQDETKDPKLTKRNIRISTVFIPVFIITITFTAFDFMMSLEPHWFSTIFGIYYFSGTVVASFAAITFISVLLKENGYLNPRIKDEHFHSMGTYMFGFNIFWAYIAFSQYLLVWYADMPEETYWYLIRWSGSWKFVSIALFVLHFAVPFIVLLPKSMKTNLRTLKIMSVWLIFAHYLDLYWLIMPTYSSSGAVFGWMEIGFPLAAVGLIILVFSFRVRRANMMPMGDPKLESGLDLHLDPDLSID
jgi:hypothetical protein